jgi:predicted regulator of Ras-like GTPase activity (Roadblock/LC7/MglB family)
MTELDQALAELRNHEGVEHVLVLGRDGLLVQHLGDSTLDVETVTAMVPAVASSSDSFGIAAGRGESATAVLELADGVAIIASLSSDLLLAALLRADVGFAPLLHTLRQERARLAALL